MPTGMSKIKREAEDSAKRSADFAKGEGGSKGLGRALMLKEPGQSAIGRVLEDGDNIWHLYVHEHKPAGKRYADRYLCLDQPLSYAEVRTYVDGTRPCFCCSELDGVPRKTRVVVNVLRYDEPKLVRGADGKGVKDAAGNWIFDGVEPAIVVMNISAGTGGRLPYLEEEKGGALSRHVLKITRTADNTNPYMIDIHQENKMPPEPWEIEFFNKKIEPPKVVQSLEPSFASIPLLTYDAMRRLFAGAAGAAAFAPGQAQGGDLSNPYAQAAAAAAGGHVNPGALGS